jgi:hypothetical protein
VMFVRTGPELLFTLNSMRKDFSFRGHGLRRYRRGRA